MQTQQFVLSVALFMVVATVILSLPLIMPVRSDIAYPAMTCRYERYCLSGNCAAPLPADFRIIPEGEYGRAALEMAGRPARLSVIRGEGFVDYGSSANDIGVLTLRVEETGRMTSELRRGDGSDEVLATGEGRCGRPVTRGDG